MLKGKGKRSKTDSRNFCDLSPEGTYQEKHRCYKRLKTCIVSGCNNKFKYDYKQWYCEECRKKLKLKKEEER